LAKITPDGGSVPFFARHRALLVDVSLDQGILLEKNLSNFF
jgi:hypothetical protein